MTLRKKLVVTTIAASVVATAFAGIPLSNKGLAEKLGVSSTAYAATFTNSNVVTEANKMYAALVKTNGWNDVVALRDAFAALSKDDITAIVSPIAGSLDVLTTEDKAVLYDLFQDVTSISYDVNLSELEAIRANSEYKAVLTKLAAGANIESLTVDDIVEYVFSLQDELLSIIDGKSIAQLTTILKDPTARMNLIKQAVNAVPDTVINVKAVLAAYGITTEEISSVVNSLQTKVSSDVVINAAGALYLAYLSLETTTPTNPGTGVGGGDTSTDVVIAIPESVTKLIDDLKAALATATAEEKVAIIAKAIQEAQTLVAQLSTIDASKAITVSNEAAAVQIKGDTELSNIAGIGAMFKALKELAPSAELPKVLLNVNLGTIAQNTTTIGLSDAIVQQAILAGLSGVNLSVNGLQVTLPVGGQFSSAISFKVATTEANETITSGLKAGSAVYDFNLSIGGQAVTTFEKPIVVRIPLGNIEGLDKELLSVAKIVDGKLVFQGGSIDGDTIIEPRDTFSSYVVVENKVSFSDIASVQAWAGRQIEVVAAKGAIEGKSAGVFAPQDKVTRAEFAKMLVRALDLDNSSAKENFSDVQASDWYAPYVAAAVELGIINGRSATKFDPNATITRAEMATMIARALKVTQGAADVSDVNAALAGFTDASSIGASLKAGVAFAASEKLVIGNNGKFLPNANSTRAEAAVIIYRALNFSK